MAARRLLIAIVYLALVHVVGGLCFVYVAAQEPEPQRYDQAPPRYDREEPHAVCRSAGSGWIACDAKSVWDPRKGASGVEWSVAVSGGEFRLRGLRITFRPVGRVTVILLARGREVVAYTAGEAPLEPPCSPPT